MMKQLIAYSFLFLATVGLLLHGLMPHHHLSVDQTEQKKSVACSDRNEHVNDYHEFSTIDLNNCGLLDPQEDCSKHIHICSFIDSKAYFIEIGVKVSSILLCYLALFNNDVKDCCSLLSFIKAEHIVFFNRELPDLYIVNSLKFRGPPLLKS